MLGEECVSVAVLTVQIQDNVDECLNMPSQAARKPGSGNQNEVSNQPGKARHVNLQSMCACISVSCMLAVL